jgi:hypothetical protein
MSQLQAVLRRSIAHLDPEDDDARQRVFASARAAMVRLLLSYDPPLTTAEIEHKISEFDRIVGEIEGRPPQAKAVPGRGSDAHASHRDDNEFRDEDDREDADHGEDEAYEDDGYEDGAYRLTAMERAVDFIQGLSGRSIAIAAAGLFGVVVLLSGGGFVYSILSGGGQESVQADVSSPATPANSVPVDASTPSPPPATAAAQLSSGPAPVAPAPANPVTAPTAAVSNSALALETLVLFDGRDPTVFQSAPDNPIHFDGDTDGGFVRIASATVSTGARIVVGRGVYERIAGRSIRIVVVARGSKDAPAHAMRFSYQNGRSVSPWFDVDLGTPYAALSGVWQVPKNRGGPASDALILEPGIPGDGTAVDIRSVRLEVLS